MLMQTSSTRRVTPTLSQAWRRPPTLSLGLDVTQAFHETSGHRTSTQEWNRADLEAARVVQAALLETPPSGEIDLLRWAVYSRAARTASGDFHDVRALADGALEAVIGDVMGKGLPAALLGAACLNHVLRAQVTLGGTAGAAAVLTEANRTLSPSLKRLDTFASVAVLRIDPMPLRLTLADAGHANVAVRGDDGSFLKLTGTETFLGVERSPYQEVSVSLRRGDLVLVWTDGLTALGERAGFDVVESLAHSSNPAEAVTALRALVAVTGSPDDDVTCLAIGVES